MNNKTNKAVESFKNFIKSKENEQNTLYENEEFYRNDIEQNELFLKMLHTVLNLIQTQANDIQRMQELLDLSDANNVKKEKTINEMAKQLYILGFCKELKCKECNADKFEECIKQYFERKINDDK